MNLVGAVESRCIHESIFNVPFIHVNDRLLHARNLRYGEGLQLPFFKNRPENKNEAKYQKSETHFGRTQLKLFLQVAPIYSSLVITEWSLKHEIHELLMR